MDCVHSEELTEVFEHYTSVGLLKAQNITSSTIDTCIMSTLSIPPSQKPSTSVGLQSIQNYANTVNNTIAAGADLYSVTVYTDIDVSEIEEEINESPDVHTNLYEEEIIASSDTIGTKSTILKAERTSEPESIENFLVTLKTFESNKQSYCLSVCSTATTDFSDGAFTKEEVRSGCSTTELSLRQELSDQTGKSVESADGETLDTDLLPFDTENSCSVQQGVVNQQTNQSGEHLPEGILLDSDGCSSVHQMELPTRQKNCQLKTSDREGIRDQKISGTPSVIFVNGVEGGESNEMTSIIFTCSQCPFYSSDPNCPPHFHMQTVHRDLTPSETTFTPSPLSTDDIFTSIKLFPERNSEQSKVETISHSSTVKVSSSHSRHKDFTCKKCGKAFTRTSDVRRHQLTHTGERPFHCSQCDRTFQHSWDLAKHESKHHGMAISFSCQICNSSFPNLRTLTVHHKNSHSEICQLPQICSICSQSFATFSELVEHRKFHVTSKRYVCQQCGEGFDTLLARSQHRQMHQVKRHFKCPLCEKTYTRRSDVKRHMSNHTGERPHQCNQCHKSFSLHFTLIKHLRVHTGERPFQCSHCFKRFTLVSVLARHERMHTGEKPFLCSQCGKSFLSQGELSKHHRSHTDERPYSCPQCDKRFKSKKSQQEHIISHSGARPYSCNYCGKGFTKPYALTRHNLIHTGERPFPCGHCEKFFLTLSEAQLHQRVHTGERPYSCKLCALKFKSSSELSRHKRSHSGSNPVKSSCEHCLKTFTSSVKLRKHMEVHENNKLL